MTTITRQPLAEIKRSRQIPGKPARRWFTSEEMDLIIWLDEAKSVRGFQLCYGKPANEHALTWNAGNGFMHTAVDDGGVNGFGHKSTPVLVAAHPGDLMQLLQLFVNASGNLPTSIVDTVITALRQHPDFRHAV